MHSKDDFVSSEALKEVMDLLRAPYPFSTCCVFGTGLKILNISPSDYKLFHCIHMSGTTSLFFGKDLLVYCYINNFFKGCFFDPFFFSKMVLIPKHLPL